MDDLLKKLARIVLMALLVCAAGCRSSAPYVWVQRLPPEPAPSARSIIGVGDVIEIQVFGDESMSTKGRVLADGTITMPLVGPVTVVGKTPEALAASLEPQLHRWIQVPKVTVILLESQVSVAVIGEVKTPGVVDLGTPAGVLQALAKAGGMTEFADWSGIYVLRSRGKSTQRIRFRYSALVEAEPAAARFQLKTGDVLVVE
jgi:polysaccharide export outer membrane protein